MDVRWPCVLRDQLGNGYWLIEEGLNGRTTVWDDPIEGYKNGKTYLIPCLESHRPIDLIVLMLGTNDMKMRFSVSAYDIGKSIGALLDIIQKSNAGPNEDAPRVLLLSPPHFGKLTEKAEMFAGAPEKARRLAEYYAAMAEEYSCHFMDTAELITASDLDGIHLEASEHLKLGKAVTERVRQIL
jgi:lysophospholipase L1-like esterase